MYVLESLKIVSLNGFSPYKEKIRISSQVPKGCPVLMTGLKNQVLVVQGAVGLRSLAFKSAQWQHKDMPFNIILKGWNQSKRWKSFIS